MKKIEEEIKQKSFKTEYQRLVANLLFTTNWLENQLHQYLKEYDVSMQQLNVLRILRGQYPCPCMLGVIQERMLDKNSNVTRLVDKLMKKELVSRSQCIENRRKVDIIITENGLDLLEKMETIEDKIEELLNNLSTQEARQVSNLLDKLRE